MWITDSLANLLNSGFCLTVKQPKRAITVKQAFPNALNGVGVFDYMGTMPWISNSDDAFLFDSEYYLNRSGDKVVSPIVESFVDSETGELPIDKVEQLARIIIARYSLKWNKIWREYSSDSSIFDNVNLETKTTYGKTVSGTNSDTLTKTGAETHTLTGEENREESYPDATGRQTKRTIAGGWKDTDTTKTTRKGTETATESYPSIRLTVKQTTGSYKDTDTTATTRTGSQTVTDRGDTQVGIYGFNSSTSVPSTVTGPTGNGLTQDTTFNGLADTKSGSITRTYGDGAGQNPLTERTEESGSKQYATSYGENGITDENAGDVTRLYNDYVDTIQETGRKNTKISYGQGGKKDTLEYSSRTDSRNGSTSSTNSGTDTTITKGYNFRNLDDKLNMLTALYENPNLNNFFEIVYSDIDEILTRPMFA